MVQGFQGPTLSPSVAGTGTFDITYVYADNNGCSDTSTQSTTVLQGPSASISGLNIGYCETDGDVTFTVSPAGGVISGTGTSGNTFSPSGAGAGTHTVYYQVTAANGCVATDSIVINVTTAAPAVASFTVNVVGKDVTFTNTSTNTSGWSWNFGDGNTSNMENPTHSFANFGTYSVCLTATNACGHTDQFCLDVEVKDVSIPNAIQESFDNAISIYPNPTNGDVNLEISLDGKHELSYSLCDVLGRSIENNSSRIDGSYMSTLNLADLQSGIYFMRISIDGKLIVKKIVLEK